MNGWIVAAAVLLLALVAALGWLRWAWLELATEKRFRAGAEKREENAKREVLSHAEPGNDFVLIARPATVDRDYRALVTDLVAGLKRLKLYRSEPQ